MKEAAAAFKCSQKQLKKFRVEDPFNPQNTLEGFMCKRDGKSGGSMFLTSCQPPALVHGTPKLLYPYTSFEDNSYGLPEAVLANTRSFALARKENGCNILFFRYSVGGRDFVSAKTKGSAVVKNGPFGAFFDLTLKALGFAGLPESGALLAHPALAPICTGGFQSIAFELCGREEPHLVRYEFDIALRPLFTIDARGDIFPCLGEGDGAALEYESPEQVYELAARCQREDYEANEAYRRANGMQSALYEHDYFAVEGRVLYMLTERGCVHDRKLFKIKPRDVEEVHWSTFNLSMGSRVREALEKLISREKPLSKESLQEELDMGPKEWGRFGADCWRYANNLAKDVLLPPVAKDHRAVLLIAGNRRSGKTRLARRLRDTGKWQGRSGSAQEQQEAMASALLGDWSCRWVVDAGNVTAKKRKEWMQLAMKYAVTRVDLVVLEEEEGTLRSRVKAKKERAVLQELESQLKRGCPLPPMSKEGFSNHYRVGAAQVDAFVAAMSAAGQDFTF